jgi:RNA polymerase sigma factor (sigma-70 family)
MVAVDDEQAWICRARDGNPEAYGVLVERYQQRIFRLVAKWLGPDHTGIEDVTQDVFVRAYTALDTFRGDASFRTWLTRIALNRCRDEHRRAVSRRALKEAFARESAALESTAQTLEAPPDTSEETGRMVHLAVASLPDKFRLVVTLKDLEGYSYEEVSRILQCKVGTVKSRHARAREKLRGLLAPYVPSLPQ